MSTLYVLHSSTARLGAPTPRKVSWIVVVVVVAPIVLGILGATILSSNEFVKGKK
jgi:hypothetical protein